MPIEDTVQAIRAAEDQRRRLDAAKRRRAVPVAQLDAILADLEAMHLRGGIKVSPPMIERIERFLEGIPSECRHPFPLRTTITRVMDNLYLVQDRLLSLKVGYRDRLRSLDEAMERDDYPAA